MFRPKHNTNTKSLHNETPASLLTAPPGFLLPASICNASGTCLLLPLPEFAYALLPASLFLQGTSVKDHGIVLTKDVINVSDPVGLIVLLALLRVCFSVDADPHIVVQVRQAECSGLYKRFPGFSLETKSLCLSEEFPLFVQVYVCCRLGVIVVDTAVRCAHVCIGALAVRERAHAYPADMSATSDEYAHVESGYIIE